MRQCHERHRNGVLWTRSRTGAVLFVGPLLALVLAACGGSPPETPSNQRYAFDDSAIVLRWDESEDAEFYKVYVSDSADPGCRLQSGEPESCVEVASQVSYGRFEDREYMHMDESLYEPMGPA